MKRRIITVILALFMLSGCYSQADVDRQYKDGYDDGYHEGYNDAEDKYDNKPTYQDGYDEGYQDAQSDYDGDYDEGYVDGYNAVVGFYEKYEGSGRFDASLIPLIPVSSSFINSVGYSPTYRVLVMYMNDDDYYAYYKVNSNIFSDLLTVSSPGEYFNKYIKNEYEYEKL